MSSSDPGAPAHSQSADRGEMAAARGALDRMVEYALRQGDAVQAGKLAELSDKLARERLTVAFCGHFSAGKSSLVNALCGAQLLPASPIPTSANVVTIVNGPPSARTVFRDVSGALHPAREIEVAQLLEYATDGEGVSTIEVSYPVPLLGDRMAIVDTPGVDSTDAAHRAATESALHLADVVLYVTDYNHVLSEVNFRFLRGLARWGKPVYLIVNQIDKHREDQLPFAEFRSGIAAALADWDIVPAAILFLSLKVPDHPLSQWHDLLQLLRDLPPLAEPLMIASAERTARYLAEQFRETLHARHGEIREALVAGLGEYAEPQARTRARREAERELAELDGVIERRRAALRERIDKLLGNASLTPAETRDKARQVLEAMQPGFKAGWLGGSAKTEQARLTRCRQLAEDLTRQASAQVEGFLAALLREEATASGWSAERLERSLAAVQLPVTAEWVRQQVKPGAGSDGQATLHYAAELGAELKAAYRKAALAWAEALYGEEAARRAETVNAVRAKLAALDAADAKAAQLAALEQAERDEEQRLLALLPPAPATAAMLPVPSALADGRTTVADTNRQPADAADIATAAAGLSSDTSPDRMADGDKSAARDAAGVSDSANAVLAREVATEESGTGAPAAATEPDIRLGAPRGVAERLEQAADLLSGVPALRGAAGGLAAAAARFRSHRFTIALFGAFSAGKSSFANALVGRPVLPVSPNPTTATINRIVAPPSPEADGTAQVTMKTAESFADDVRHSLRRIGVSREQIDAAGDDIARLLALRDKVTAADLHPKGRPHLAFLNAAAAGYAAYGPLLGQTFIAREADYRRYAAEETASCFVAEIDLYADCPLTRGGAVLVDTPGADSINARHTGVAFQYIKNADAVLFVTYYNHAFTEADREFLNQLGSVKDVFELDKMFFVINAADLASSDAELATVERHVAAQLLKHGIRQPRLFGVSSLQGLAAKEQKDDRLLAASGLSAFESAFRAFAQEELGGLALVSVGKELERIERLISGLLHSSDQDSASRQALSARLAALAGRWRETAARPLPEALLAPLRQEIGEQLYHLRQRLLYRFREHFQTSFHPSVLQDDGRDLKQLLVLCGEDLKRSLGEDLLQELRAAGLRLEGTVAALAESRRSALDGLDELAAQGFAPAAADKPSLELPLPQPFAGGAALDARRLWGAFRSPKHFFEQEGAARLRAELADELLAAIDGQLAALKETWERVAGATYEAAARAALETWAEQLAAYAAGLAESSRLPEERRLYTNLLAKWREIRKL